MSQLAFELTPPRALARADDPETSVASAHTHRHTRARHLALVLNAYAGAQDLTDVEASVISRLDRIETTRRASELRNAGLIERVVGEDGQFLTRTLPSGKQGMVCQITPAGLLVNSQQEAAA